MQSGMIHPTTHVFEQNTFHGCILSVPLQQGHFVRVKCCLTVSRLWPREQLQAVLCPLPFTQIVGNYGVQIRNKCQALG